MIGLIIYFFLSSGLQILARDHTLNNGLKIIFVEDHSIPAVAIQLWYRVGSRNEVDGIRGISHLLEHMMFKGSAHVGPEEHMRTIGRIGGRTNAFTSEDVTVYHQVVPADSAELIFRLEADRMARLTLSADELITEREVVKEELRVSIENSPSGQLYRNLLKNLFSVHPYQYPVVGTLQDLDAITSQTLQEYYHRYYAPDNAVLVVVGDLTWGRVLGLAEKYFGTIQDKRGEIISIPQEPPLAKDIKVKFKLPMHLARSGIAWRIPHARHPDIPAIEVVVDVLTRGKSSRLYTELVRRQKLGIEVSDVTEILQDPGYLEIIVTHNDPADADSIQKLIMKTVEEISLNGVTNEELQRARNHLMANFVFNSYSFAGQAFGLGRAEIYNGDYHFYLNRPHHYDRLTSEDIKRVTTEYLLKSKRVQFEVEPEKVLQRKEEGDVEK